MRGKYTWLIVLGVVVALLGVLAMLGGGRGGWKSLLIGLSVALAGVSMNQGREKG